MAEVSESGWKVMDKGWERMQIKTFTAWCNTFLKRRGLKIGSLIDDLDSGIALINLLEVVFEKDKLSLGRYDKNPRMRIHKIANVNIALKFINQFIRDVGIKTEFGPTDIVDHNLKLILGMTWVIIHKAAIEEISEEELTAREGLLLWCKKKTAGYRDVNVRNFNTSWQSGLAFCALIHKHRPDLINYDSLSEANAKENLNLAFDVAETNFDIPKILDAEDMISMKPDDKSVMTYVAYYWKTFAGSNKTELAARRLGKLVSRREASDKLRNTYLEKAQALHDWTNAKTGEFASASDFGNSSAEVQAKLDTFMAYRANEKSVQVSNKLDVDAIYGTLQAKLNAEGSPPFVPPEHLSPEMLNYLWTSLGNAEGEYERVMRDYLKKMKRLELLLQQFDRRADKLVAWESEKQQQLNDTDTGNSLGAVQAKIKMHEAYEDEVKANESRFIKLQQLGQEIISLEPNFAESVNGRIEAIGNGWTSLSESAMRRQALLDDALIIQQNLENLRMGFAKKAEELNLWVEDAKEELEDPVIATSVLDVEQLRAAHTNLDTAHKNTHTSVQQLADLANQLAASGVLDNPYTRFSVDGLNERYGQVSGLLADRGAALDAEMVTQQTQDALRLDFAQKAQAAMDSVTGINQRLDSLSGAVEDQLASADQTSLELPKCQDLLDAARGADQQLVAAHVTENRQTELSQRDLDTAFDALQNRIQEQRKILQNEISLKNASNISVDLMKEYRDTFDHFDKDKSGTLERHEFAAVLQSLDMVLPEEKITETFVKYSGGQGSMSFEHFITFMQDLRKDTDTPEEILDAFATIAGGKEYITVNELKAVLTPEQLAYCTQNMPMTEGGYDYRRFTADSFAP